MSDDQCLKFYSFCKEYYLVTSAWHCNKVTMLKGHVIIILHGMLYSVVIKSYFVFQKIGLL